ncbi:hypothetical protein PoB_000600400 [Plakobranchus ocellatus]|uniref:Uncharacterized protein n=1 Tax=Plakobranchus ocellatus TaxID=259542 RepID=A0AAV3Y982_9GAST|nr:hypothetical protein PoB_000600400 [Plakobranchus ocellatus]
MKNEVKDGRRIHSDQPIEWTLGVTLTKDICTATSNSDRSTACGLLHSKFHNITPFVSSTREYDASPTRIRTQKLQIMSRTLKHHDNA